MPSLEEDAARRFLELVSEPHRWALLRELSQSDRRVGELTTLLDKPQSLVSYHLTQLRDSGLVHARRSSADGRDTFYRIDLVTVCDRLATIGGALHPGLAPDGGLVARRSKPVRVLFLCTGNSARSQMAEAILEHQSNGRILAASAGSHPKALHPNAVRVMKARGIDIAGRETKHHQVFARTRFARVITLCDKVKEICPEFPNTPQIVHWSMGDPAAEGDTNEATYKAFVRTADELEGRIRFLIAELDRVSPKEKHYVH